MKYNCAICGQPIIKNATKDHVIPQAIYKWNEQLLKENEYEALKLKIRDNSNIIYVHCKCNVLKADNFLDINKLYLSENKKNRIKKTILSINPYIKKYYETKEDILQKQGNKCYKCGKELQKVSVLRKIDDDSIRVYDNACVVCNRCNNKYQTFIENGIKRQGLGLKTLDSIKEYLMTNYPTITLDNTNDIYNRIKEQKPMKGIEISYKCKKNFTHGYTWTAYTKAFEQDFTARAEVKKDSAATLRYKILKYIVEN